MKLYISIFYIFFYTYLHSQSNEFYITYSDIQSYTHIYNFNIETCELDLQCRIDDHIGLFVFHPDGTPYFISNRNKAQFVPDTADIYEIDLETCTLTPTPYFFSKDGGYGYGGMTQKGEFIYQFNNTDHLVNLKNGETNISPSQYIYRPLFFYKDNYYTNVPDSALNNILASYDLQTDSLKHLINFGYVLENGLNSAALQIDENKQCDSASALILKSNYLEKSFDLVQYNIENNTSNIICSNPIYGDATLRLVSTNEYLSHINNCELLIDLDADNSSGAFPNDYNADNYCGTNVVNICDDDLYMHSSRSEGINEPPIDSITLIISNALNGLNEQLIISSPQSNVDFYQLDDSTYVLKGIGNVEDIYYHAALASISYINDAVNLISGQRIIKVKGYSSIIVTEDIHCYINVGNIPYSGRDTTISYCENLEIANLISTIGAVDNGTWSPPLFIDNSYNSSVDISNLYQHITFDNYCGNDTATVIFNQQDYLRSSRDTFTCTNQVLVVNNVSYNIGDTIILIKSNASECDSIIEIVYQERIDMPANIILPKDTICFNEMAQVNITNCESVIWDDGNIELDRSLSPGNYPVEVTYNDGCIELFNVSIEAYPIIDFTAVLDPAICDQDNGAITIEPANAISSLTSNGINHTGNSIQNLKPDIYELDITDMNNCVITLSNLIIDESDSQAPQFESTYELEQGEIIEIPIEDNFTIIGITADKDSSVITHTGASLFIIGAINQTITVDLMDENGCLHQINFDIHVLDNDTLSIPNVIMISASQFENSTWQVPLPYGAILTSCHVKDRWGNVVYSTNDQILWDGTSNGEHCMKGVYIYQINYILPNGESKLLIGDVTLL